MGLFRDRRPFFERLGGREVVARVHHIFYGKIYGHPWISQYFAHTPREHIEKQQTDFMSGLMGGPKEFAGRAPAQAHAHMLIKEELFTLRHTLLRLALNQAGVPNALAKEWLALDLSFKNAVIKPEIGQCRKRVETDQILSFQNPLHDVSQV